MKDSFAKCGNNCGRCSLYTENLTDDKRQWISEGMGDYIGWKPKPETLKPCAGCQASDDGFLYLKNCPVRRCAQYNQIDNCAYCGVFPCQFVPNVSVSVEFRDKVSDRLGKPIPEADYLAFIEPYEGMKHLETIRLGLAPEALIPPKEVRPLRVRKADFPPKLPLPPEEEAALEALHGLMSDILTGKADLCVKQMELKKRRKEILNLLWAFGCYGELSADGSQLAIASQDCGSQPTFINIVRKKDNTLHISVATSVSLLADFGIIIKHEPLSKKEWLLTMAMSDQVNGRSRLEALKSYVTHLIKIFGEPEYAGSSKYKGEAYDRFRRLDMQAMAS